MKKKIEFNERYFFAGVVISLIMCVVGVSGLANPNPSHPIFYLVVTGLGIILISSLITFVVEGVFLTLKELKEVKQEIRLILSTFPTSSLGDLSDGKISDDKSGDVGGDED